MPDPIAKTSLFAKDLRSAEEQLLTIAEIGSESPEALTLEETKALCRAYLRKHQKRSITFTRDI